MKNESGYSLIELLIVLAIIAVLTGLAQASFTAQLPHLRLSHAARTLVSDLRWARQLAVASGQPVSVVLDIEQDRYQIERQSQPGIPIGWVRDLQDRGQGFGEIDLVSSSGGRAIAFQPNGISTDMTTIILKNGGKEQRQITVAITGRVKIKP